MSWFRCDDQLADHPKVVALGALRVPAIGLWAMCGTYCSKHLTDGYVSEHVVTMYAGKEAKRLATALVNVGLFIPADGGFQLHDYLDWNPSRDEVMEKRARAAESGRAGGLAKARHTAKRNAKQGAKQEGTQPAYTRPDPSTSPANAGDAREIDQLELAVRKLRHGNASQTQIETMRGFAEQVGEPTVLTVLDAAYHEPKHDRYGIALRRLEEIAADRKPSRRQSRAVTPLTSYDSVIVSDDDEAIPA